MKKIISIALSAVLLLTTVLTVPIVFADNLVSITNTYEETDISTINPSLFGTDNHTKVATGPSGTSNTSKVTLFENLYGASNQQATAVKIYDPNDSDYKAFAPEKNAYYKITFDYYLRYSYHYEIQLNVYGNTDDTTFKGKQLANVVSIPVKDPEFNSSAWRKATVYVSIEDNEFKSLSICAELTGLDTYENLWTRIDNVKLEEVDSIPGEDDNEPTTKIVNTFEEEGFGTKPNGTTSTLKNNALVASDTYIKSWATANSIVAQLEQVYMPNAEKAAGIKIYNPNDANFAAFAPEKNAYYKITFDYYYARKSADIELSIYGNTTDDGFKDTKLASAVYIGKNDTNFSTSSTAKNTATVYVNIGDTEYKSLSIVAELANHTNDTEDFWGRIDNVTLEKVDTSVIENTYEEAGFGTKTSSTSSTLKNNALVASDTYIKSWTTANSIVAQLEQVYKSSAEKAAGVKIYNPYDANFAAFAPEKNAYYKITFDYYYARKYADIELSIYGNTTDDGFKDTKLASAVYIGKNDTNFSTSSTAKNTATVYVNIGDTEYKSLSIVAELANHTNDTEDFWGRIDNVTLEKVDLSVIENTYEETGLGSVVNGSGTHKLKGKNIYYLGIKSASGREGRVLQFSTISGQTNVAKGSITHVELYNPTDKDFASIKPQKDTTYKIKFDYKIKADGYCDISFNIRGVKNGGLSDVLKTATTIIKGDARYSDYAWGTTTVFVNTGSEELSALAISIESSSKSDAIIYPYLDNIEVNVIPNGNTTLTCHNFDPAQLTLSNDTLFSDIPVGLVSGKKFEGWYLDENFNTPAEDNVYGHTEIWAKWRTTGDVIKNTYDDNGVYFKVDNSGYISRYSDSALTNCIDSNFAYSYFGRGALVDDDTYGKSMQLTNASVISNTNPPLVRIYDNTKSDKSIYKPRANAVYKISFDIKSTAILDHDAYIAVKAYNNLSGSFGKGEFLKYLYTVKAGIVVRDWTKVEGYITVPDANFDFLGISLMTSNTANTSGAQVWVDNVVLTEVMDTYYLSLNRENGEKDTYVPFVAGVELPTLPQIKKDGYVLAGWFTDSAKTVPFTYNKMPAANIEIYAKWTAVAQNAIDFSTGFEADDFNSGVTPYTNTGVNNKYTNNMSAAVSIVTDSSDAYEGSKYLHFVNEAGSGRQTMNMASVALINPDGTNYQVKEGERYIINLALRSDSYCYIVPVVTEQVPTAKLSFENCTEIGRVHYQYMWYHSPETWGEMKAYFTPNISGKVHFLVYYECNYADIDALSIEATDSSEVSIVQYYNEAGTSITSKSIGGVGDWLFTPVPSTKTGYVFDGWYDKDGNQYIKSVFPKGDLNLYPRYRVAEDLSNPETLKEGTLEIDFESNVGKAQAYYQSNKNSFINNKDAIFVTNDPSGAHSGGNYLKFNNAGQWTRTAYRRFRLYDDNSVGNRVYLEPYSVYRVGFWMKVDRTWAATMRLATFDNTDAMAIISDQTVVSLTEVETEDNYGEWIYYEGDITTGADVSTLGIMLTGGFVTASIDDITVRKLAMMTVSFDSNGGSKVDSIETLEGQCIVAPIEPEKEGYVFEGWYTDAEFTNLFEFNSTAINNNIKLYAKWTKAKEQEYKDVITYIKEEILQKNEIKDSHLDGPFNILDNDIIGQVGSHWLVIALIIAGALVLVAVSTVVIIVLIKRKKKSN